MSRAFHWLLGLVLIWASLSKLGDLQSFYGTLLAYQLPLPNVILRLTAQVLPWAELFCGLMLLTGFCTDAALLLGCAMFGVFVMATGQAWYRGLEISCGCLDLRLLGMAEGSPAAEWLATPQFAFWRALGLALLTLCLLPAELKPKSEHVR